MNILSFNIDYYTRLSSFVKIILSAWYWNGGWNRRKDEHNSILKLACIWYNSLILKALSTCLPQQCEGSTPEDLMYDYHFVISFVYWFVLPSCINFFFRSKQNRQNVHIQGSGTWDSEIKLTNKRTELAYCALLSQSRAFHENLQIVSRWRVSGMFQTEMIF